MDRSPETKHRKDDCATHGPFDSRHLFRSIWSRCPGCQEKDEAERRVEQQREAERLRAIRVRVAGIPARFVGRDFDGFKAASEAHNRAVTVARDYVEQFAENCKKGRGLVFSGLPGTGKSHLALAILQALIDRDVRYTTCLDMIREVRDGWRRDAERSETAVLRDFGALELLVIDEVGMQYGTEGEQTIISDVLDRRYREMRPTILLTNQDKAGLKQFVGERSFDRLTETCRWVPFDWQSYRPQARKEAL